jgi:hypothetical protein
MASRSSPSNSSSTAKDPSSSTSPYAPESATAGVTPNPMRAIEANMMKNQKSGLVFFFFMVFLLS